MKSLTQADYTRKY